MDYGKSGIPKSSKSGTSYVDHNAKGTDKNPFGEQSKKAELLARMKAAADAKTQK